jgi:UDP-N-acetylglucosamine 4,6-dehydratase
VGRGGVVANLGSVLITGGTGFFGRAFTRHLLDNDMSERICIFSRSEFAQHAFRDSLGDDDRCRWFIGDVRDQDRLRRAMAGVDLVVHAAALKRIEVCHYNPYEAVATNVNGTINAVHAAFDAGVKRLILLSTDKACEPISTYGYTKALAEQEVLCAYQYRPRHAETIFAVTRYGNVANSTGSLIPRWMNMIDNGAIEVPVTDPGCTRFWMWEHQAVKLVVDTALTMSGQELVIPTLPAYRVGDLAEAMGVSQKILGLGSHEKRHESMRPGETSEFASRLSIPILKTNIQLLRQEANR